MKKRLFLALLLSLGVTATTTGHVTAPITVVDQSYFTLIAPQPSATVIAPTIHDFDKDKAVLILEQPILKNESKVEVIKPKSTPKAKTLSGSKASGLATWFCKSGVSSCHYKYPDRSGAQMYAAAGSEIRVGKWRGRIVQVCGGSDCIQVKLVDWCACKGNRIIDLYYDAFRKLESPSRGYVKVKVSW